MLPVLGPAGVGETALLKRLHERFPSSIYIECSGLTVDEVARRLLAEFSIDAVDLWSKDPLFDAVVKIRRDAIILLADVQWAGPLFTSREPDRIAGSLATTFAAHSRGCVRVVVEADSPRDRVSVRRANEIILDEEPTTSDRLTTAASSPELRALRALAASEVHDTPLAVWQHLCSALGERTDAASLQRLAEQLPATVHLHETATGAGVRFTSRSLKYDIRSHNPLTATEHLAIAEALLTSARAPRRPRRSVPTGPVPQPSTPLSAGPCPGFWTSARTSWPSATGPGCSRRSPWHGRRVCPRAVPPLTRTTWMSKGSHRGPATSGWRGCTGPP